MVEQSRRVTVLVKIIRCFTFALCLCASVSVFLSGAHANDVRTLGSFRDWSAAIVTEGTRATCYMNSQPTQYVPADPDRHGQVLMYVTHFPGDGQKNEVSLTVGYGWHPNANVTLTVGDKRYPMITQDKTAWVRDQDALPAVVGAMRKGITATFSGKSQRGTATKYTFSLRGFSKAHQAISTACGL